MEENKDLKYYVGLECIQHLLDVYSIEDCEPSGRNFIKLITTAPHTLSKIINVGFASARYTADLASNKEYHDECEALHEAKKMHDFLKSCIHNDITLKGSRQKSHHSEVLVTPPRITIGSILLKEGLLHFLEGLLNSVSDTEMLQASRTINRKDASMNEKLGYIAWFIIKQCFAGYELEVLLGGKKYKARLYSFIYDLFLKAGLVYRDDCKHEGYEHGGWEKWLQVRDWIEKGFLRNNPNLI